MLHDIVQQLITRNVVNLKYITIAADAVYQTDCLITIFIIIFFE